MSRPSVIAALVSVVLIILALTVWPTVYRYDRMKLGGGRDFPVRIHRISGTTHFLTPDDGWVLLKEPEPVKEAWRDAPIVQPAKPGLPAGFELVDR